MGAKRLRSSNSTKPLNLRKEYCTALHLCTDCERRGFERILNSIFMHWFYNWRGYLFLQQDTDFGLSITLCLLVSGQKATPSFNLVTLMVLHIINHEKHPVHSEVFHSWKGIYLSKSFQR